MNRTQQRPETKQKKREEWEDTHSTLIHENKKMIYLQ